MQQLTCFFSMRYSSASADRVFAQLSKVCEDVGLRPVSGARGFEPWKHVRGKIEAAIDAAFVVVVDTSAFSWWVALELFTAIDRKACIPLVLDVDGRSAETREAFPSVFPDVDFVRYRASDGGPSLEQQLRDALIKVLHGADKWSRWISQSSLDAYAPERPFPFVESSLESDGGVELSGAIFESWLNPGKHLVDAAIVGPPGSGKTLLLAEFARWVNVRRSTDVEGTHDLRPVTIFLPATELPEKVDLMTFLRERVRRWETAAEVQGEHWLRNAGLFEPYRQAGLVYLLLDGVDEFVVRRRDETEHLLEGIAALRRQGVHVVLSCRENLWWQQLRSATSPRTLKVLPLNQSQAMQLLRVDVPENAKDHEGRLKDWLRNPLLLGFLQDLTRRNRSVWFNSRTELYEHWAQEALGSAARSRLRVDPSCLLNCYGAAAVTLLRSRKKKLPVLDVRALINSTFGQPSPLTEQVTDTEVLRNDKETAEIEFAHESVYEFFVARAVRDDFVSAMEPTASSSTLQALALAEVELDFPQSAVYGFLREMLGVSFGRIIQDRLPTLLLMTAPQSWRLVRNLVEYLGMTHEGGDDRALATTLMDVAENEQLLARVRYNALRALERMHPCAPRPYYKHVSDWGPLDYAALRRIANEPEDRRPWVMRGHGRMQPQPGRHWAWVPPGLAWAHDVSVESWGWTAENSLYSRRS